MRRTLLVLGKAALISLVLFLLWRSPSRAYAAVLNLALAHSYGWLYPGLTLRVPESTAYAVSTHLIPFLALALVMPGIRPSRKAIVVTQGTIIFLVFDLSTTLLGIPQSAYNLPGVPAGPLGGSTAVYLAYRCVLRLLPVFFWLLLMRPRPMAAPTSEHGGKPRTIWHVSSSLLRRTPK